MSFVAPKPIVAPVPYPSRRMWWSGYAVTRVEQAQRLLALGIRATDDMVVCDRGDGLPLDPSTYTHALSRLAKGADLAGVRLHDLRHGVGTTVAARGTPPELTSRMLGHANVAFTLTTYVHPTDDRLDAVGEMLGRALGGAS